MHFLSLIEAKREGKELATGQIKELVALYTQGKIPDYQMAAFLMAIYFRGLTTAETAALTLAMRDSGDTLAFPNDSRPVVDKHSTGGVGDKVSLPLAPLLACLGFRVPMISGRGLGITGGTLDKLDSIPGFRTLLPTARIIEIVQDVGCVICGQTDRMAPADKALYALRDVTGTVPSIPLIVASILSKKLAEGLHSLILDVKCGTAAFMPTSDKARELASAMVTLGNSCGVKTRALITNMDSPIGRAAGNWLEVKESVACLSPGTSHTDGLEDLRELVVECAAHLMIQTGKTPDLPTARTTAQNMLASGVPLKKWHEMIAAQGADMTAFPRKLELHQLAPVVMEVKAQRSGYVARCDARIVGEAIRDLGGGRLSKESVINYDVGIDRLAKPGEKVKAGQAIGRVHGPDSARTMAAVEQVLAAFEISEAAPQPRSVLMDTVLA